MPWSECRESRPLLLLRAFILNCVLNLYEMLFPCTIDIKIIWVFWIVFSNNVKIDIFGRSSPTDMYY